MDKEASLARRFANVLTVLAVALAAYLAIGQFSSSKPFSQRLENESEGDLARILASLTTSTDQLNEEVNQLKLQLLSLKVSSQRDDAAAQADHDRIRNLEVLAGTVPVTGPGILLTVTDPGLAVGYDLFIDLVQELRDAGAEAVALNGKRVGALTSFTPTGADGRGVSVDGVVLTSPYTVGAIGQPATLDGGLAIPGGSLDTLRAQPDVRVEVVRATRVDLPALDHPPTFKVARPVGSGK